ncbi:MAG: winged helix-turn-helix domain-containing protein [Chloroflexota bacterium]
MTDQIHSACLLIAMSTEPESNPTTIYLSETCTQLGRPESHQVGVDFIDLDLPSVSRHHAQVVRQNDTYTLENIRGRYGIGLFEKELQSGTSMTLQHGYVFRIPDLEQHFRILFLQSTKETQLWPLHIEHVTQRVYIFGAQVRLSRQEYDLLHFLFINKNHICRYDQIIDHLWPGLREKGVVDKGKNLDVLLANVRKVITQASGGFTFMQTIRGEGIRLVI